MTMWVVSSMSRFVSASEPPAWFRDPLTPAGWRIVQRKLGLPETGSPDRVLYAAVAGFQKARGLPGTGEVDEVTAALLGPSASESALPDWWLEEYESDPLAVACFLAIHDRDLPWLKRLQGNHGLKPTGLIDKTTASVLEIEL